MKWPHRFTHTHATMQLFLNVLAWCVTGVGQGPFKKALEQLAGSCNKSTRSNAGREESEEVAVEGDAIEYLLYYYK